jgi:hypothetical protein
MGFTHHRTLLRLIFRTPNARPRVDLPTQLNRIPLAAPGALIGSGEDIIRNNTLLPFYQAFINSDWSKRLMVGMTDLELKSGRVVVGLNSLKVGQPVFLKGCAECWKEDLKRGIDRYWRRSHQAPGTWLCSIHEGPLLESTVRISNGSIQRTVSAVDAQGTVKPCKIEHLNQPVLLRIARGATWLLNNYENGPSPRRLRNGYIQALQERGLADTRLRFEETTLFIRETIGDQTLEALSSRLNGKSKCNWVNSLLYEWKSDRVGQPPLRHLILMAALGHEPKTFFEAAMQESCCEKIIQKLPKAEKPSTCESREDRDKIRAQFLDFRKRFPNLSQKALGNSGSQAARTIRWLQKHDYEWLKENRLKQVCLGGNPGADWKRRDRDYSQMIPSVIKRLKQEGLKVSLAAIGRKLGFNLVNCYKKMPEVLATLEANSSIPLKKNKKTTPRQL